MNQPILPELDVLILCGGAGKRLRTAVSNRPKAMAEINNRPFLEILVSRLAARGLRRFILGVGYRKEYIINYFQEYSNKNPHLSINFSEEKLPLGTGGAVKNALPFIQSKTFLVLNGDTLFHKDFDFVQFYKSHKKTNSLLSIVLSKAETSADYGNVEIDHHSRILSFTEKKSSDQSALVSAGVYLMEKDIGTLMPAQTVFSLEYDFFPTLVNKNCHGFLSTEVFYDIGTPERYANLKSLIKSV